MIRVAAFTGGARVPSARYRVRQFVAPLHQLGIAVHEDAARYGTYPTVTGWRRVPWVAASAASRLPAVLGSWRADVTWLQREFVSTLVTLEPLTRAPRVFDVDDALWLLPRGAFARRLASRCDRIIAGNAYLAEYFSAVGRPIEIIPTAVDTEQYRPAPAPESAGITIGWSGSSSGLPYLLEIEPALAAVCRARPNVRILVMADRPPAWRELPATRTEFVEWSPSVEIPTLQRMDIGVMPLRDGAWERGKCSFKMLQYMACGAVPVVSPVGMNVDVLSGGRVGLPAASSTAWVEGLLSLVDDQRMRQSMAVEARARVESSYSVRAVTPALATALSQW